MSVDGQSNRTVTVTVFCVYIVINKCAVRLTQAAQLPISMQRSASVSGLMHQSASSAGLCCAGVLLSPHGNPENAFVTLNPCSVSVDDIIV